MAKLLLPVITPSVVAVDIDPGSVVVHPHRFSAKTTNGMNVSISVSERAKMPIIEMLATSKDNSRPPTIVGEVPPRLYGELLRGALGVSPQRSIKKLAGPRCEPEVARLNIQWNESGVSAEVSKGHAANGADGRGRRVLAALASFTRSLPS